MPVSPDGKGKLGEIGQTKGEIGKKPWLAVENADSDDY